MNNRSVPCASFVNFAFNHPANSANFVPNLVNPGSLLVNLGAVKTLRSPNSRKTITWESNILSAVKL